MTPLAQTAGQVLIAGFPGLEANEELVDAAARGALGGIILFRRNIEEPNQVSRLIASFRPPTGAPPLLIAVDQEGGRVQRLGPPILQLPPMRTLGAIDDPGLTHRAGMILGRQLAALGFNLDFAPVLDVDTNPKNPVIGDRSFGRTAATVIRHGRAFAQGLAESGILSCGKHFPGHGDTSVDSHLELPCLPHSRKRLDEVELAPFRALMEDLPTIMTAHVLFEELDPEVPATLSHRVVTGLLREELGYQGVIVSDDLEMRAIRDRYGIDVAAVQSIEAGCDALLICSQVAEVFEVHAALVQRAEEDDLFAHRLRNAAARMHALRMRCAPHAPQPTLPDELQAIFESDAAHRLLEEIGHAERLSSDE